MTETFSEALSATAELFASANVPAQLAAEAVARLGPDAATTLRSDPWRLLSLPAVRPDQADFFARALLGGEATPHDTRRGAALAGHLLLRAAGDGHTVMPAKALLSAIESYDPGDAIEAVRAAIGNGDISAIMDEESETEELGLSRFTAAEESIAEGVARLAAMAEPLPPTDALPKAVLENGVSILTGSPEAVEALVTGLAALPGVVVTAATDRAASAAGGTVSLHRLLEPVPGGYARGVERPIEADLIIVTEATSLGLERAAALADACMDGTHLVFAGDPAAPSQLGPGRVLADLIASGSIPVTALDPPPHGAIGRLVAGVRDGTLAPVDSADREVVIVPAGEAREAAHRAVQLVTDSIPRALGIPADEVLVVAPAQRGEAGAAALNQALKARLNPGPGPYDVGDRVVAVTDLPDAAAGEFGTVASAGGSAGTVGVTFPSGTAQIPVAALRHGWAVTVHRAQGTRWPAVVAVLAGETAGALSRALVVGAFTRAGRHLSVVHAAGPDLARAVRERTEPARRTRLPILLREATEEAMEEG
jgi:exodeoxyribonuclease V alpha subunit